MMDKDFGHWLAGFIDGEGCFRVHKSKNGAYYSCHFGLKVRDDEKETIEEIIRCTGFGAMKWDKASYGTSKPQVTWVIHSRENCVKLVHLLDEFPLRAKKRRDYAVWREAVIYWASHHVKGNRWHGVPNWQPMIDFKERIETVRVYCPPS